jgi:hypothetical protein
LVYGRHLRRSAADGYPGDLQPNSQSVAESVAEHNTDDELYDIAVAHAVTIDVTIWFSLSNKIAEPVAVVEPNAVAEPVPVAQSVWHAQPHADSDTFGDIERITDAICVPNAERECITDYEPVGLSEPVAERLSDWHPHSDSVAEPDPECLPNADLNFQSVTESESDADALTVELWLPNTVCNAFSEPDHVSDPESSCYFKHDPLTEPDAVALGESRPSGVR